MSDSAVFFEPWFTDYADDDLHVLQVSYLNGGLDATKLLEDGRYGHFEVQPDRPAVAELTIKLFSYSKSEVFEILFPDTIAHRILDEHSLAELWPLARPNHAMFRVGGHGWTVESPVSFALGDEKSWMIVTDWDCVEVVATTAPIVRKIGPVARAIVDQPDDYDMLEEDPILAGSRTTKRWH